MTPPEFRPGTRSFAREGDLTFHRAGLQQGAEDNQPASAATDLRNALGLLRAGPLPCAASAFGLALLNSRGGLSAFSLPPLTDAASGS